MSTEAIQQVMQELEALPESDQRLVLGFLATIKGRRRAGSGVVPAPTTNPALAVKAGLLVFTGKVVASATDWVQWERDEREKELAEAAMAQHAPG